MDNKHMEGGRKRLNHLMSVFNDAWRYLDLCFMPFFVALGGRNEN